MKTFPTPEKSQPLPEGITQITVSGYKSIHQEQSIEIKPLTILAGANSSGKSSIIQPLLLLKQTLEASYDPGALLLSGPNVRFTSADQLLSRVNRGRHADIFHIGISAGSSTLTIYFKKYPGRGFEIQQMISASEKEVFTLRMGMPYEEMRPLLPPVYKERSEKHEALIVRNHCFLELRVTNKENRQFVLTVSLSKPIETYLHEIIHLPGLRGNPERTYPVTAVGPTFPGTFEKYAASVIAQWQTDKDNDRIEGLSRDLEEIGLTWRVMATPINDTQVELKVGRLTHPQEGGRRDLVNIADVGFGVSQTLPVLVALHVAEEGQLVYLEQPEIHLHPRAQSAMAQVLANAANRGVRVVAETHSSLLLLGIQTLVAEGKLSPEMVKLHWFTRREDGSTEVRSADLDESGAFGDWPEDFAEVALETESRYLDAAESRQRMR